jgi:IclR family pca regulon transcriptional regulator
LEADKKYIVPATAQAVRILLCLSEADSSHLSLNQICSRVGLHRSRVYSHLCTLQEFGFTQRNIGGKGYSLGPGLIALSSKVIDNLNIPHLAKPMLEDLAKESDCTAVLALILDDHLSIVAKHEGINDLGITMRLGLKLHLTHGAEGKAIAAFMSEKELYDLLKQKSLYFYGVHKKPDKALLLKELEECRHLWYALSIGEYTPGVNSVAAPVLGPTGKPIGCITVIGIVSPNRTRQLGPRVAEAGKELSRLLGAVLE